MATKDEAEHEPLETAEGEQTERHDQLPFSEDSWEGEETEVDHKSKPNRLSEPQHVDIYELDALKEEEEQHPSDADAEPTDDDG